VLAFLACAAWATAFFLPWVVVDPQDRERVGAAFCARIDEIEQAAPGDAEGCRAILDQVVAHGRLGGLDLLHYARRAASLHALYEGEEPRGPAGGAPWTVRRAFRLFGAVLAGLPLGCVLLGAVLLGRGLRRPGPFTLTALLVLGIVGGALALAGLRISEGLGGRRFHGLGLQLGTAASLVQVSVGVLSLTRRTWWRVALGALLALAVLGAAAWAFLLRGAVL
jgi:hypothetical protein